VEAARLLGRWTLIAERHGGGCSCCPGLGDVGMEEVERRIGAWMEQRHDGFGRLSDYLRRCIARRSGDDAIFRDLDEALAELERIQSGLA
jgi:hypothetical protein